jgi:hypothetical protein
MDCNFDENRYNRWGPVYQKLVGQIYFFWKFEIKNSKKTRVYFKIFGKNRIKIFEVTHPRKFGEVKMLENHEKRKSIGFHQKQLSFLKNRSVFHSPLHRCSKYQLLGSQHPSHVGPLCDI